MIKQLILLVAFITTYMNAPLLAVEPYSPKALGFQIIAEAEADPLTSPYSSTNQEIVSVKMVSEDSAIVPGKSFWVAFQFTMGPEWHLYWKNPGDAGQGPMIEWSLPAGFQVADVFWPAPERIQIDQSVIYGYSNKLVLLAQITTPQDLKTGSSVDVKAKVDWFGCSSVCVPGEASFDMKLQVADAKQEVSKPVASLFKRARSALPLDASNTQAAIKGDTLEIRVHQDMPFSSVKNAYFFVEQQDVLDPRIAPAWELSDDNSTLIVRVVSDKLSQSDVQFPLRGVLVVEEQSSLGKLSAAWNIQVSEASATAGGATVGEDSKSSSNDAMMIEQQKATGVEAHLEALENTIWYRNLLTQFSLFIKSELAKIILWAFLGGLLLNIMPCVLPVVSFKLLHFVQLRGHSRMTAVKHGLLYTFGVLLSFWALSATIYALQSVGHIVGWGFQLQEPMFVTFLIIVLFILSLSLFGVFEFGVSVSSTTGAWDQSFSKRIATTVDEPSYTSSFASGILAAFVAAPCTGPLLGSAIGFAATLNPTSSFAIFSALGLGMASPFLLISLFPGLIKILPKPGRWMVTFKQLMGFLMLATVLWLVWVLDAQTMGLSNILLLLSLFIIGFGTWIYGNWGGYDREKSTRIIATLAALAVIAGGSWFFIANVKNARATAEDFASKTESPVSQVVGKEWETFSLPSLQRYVQKGVPVFVDVTAKWCLTCQTNHIVLESDKVKDAFVKYGVVKMKADWTMNDENITRYIRSLGRNGVPVYVVYSTDPAVTPVVLPEVITPEMVIEAIRSVSAQEKTGK